MYQPSFTIAGEDYESADSILTLTPMEQVLKYDILITDDQRVERLETFSVLLVSGLTLGQSITNIFIKDNDCESCIRVVDYKLATSDSPMAILIQLGGGGM